MEKLKINKKIIIPIVLVVLVIALSLTYAWFVWTDNGGETVKIKGGSLALRLDESSGNGIRLIRSIPMSDEQGLATQAYTFSVVNRGSMNAKYSLSLENLDLDSENGENVRMNDSNIRYSITRNGSNENPQALISRTIESNVIVNAGKTDTYTLKVWIQSEATREIAEQVFKVRIKLDAVETEESAVPAKNVNLISAYKYDETKSSNDYCLGGQEAGCKQLDDSITEYPVGTIIQYKVNASETKWFNVLSDNGDTLTLQQRENTVSSKAWHESNTSINGPSISSSSILGALEEETDSWTYVNEFDYSIGDETTTLGYSGCGYSSLKCNAKAYPQSGNFTRSNVRARMITMQELLAFNCTTSYGSCKKFLYNYLIYAKEYGGTFDTDANMGYWIMSAEPSENRVAWNVSGYGRLGYIRTSDTGYGARAVVVIDK